MIDIIDSCDSKVLCFRTHCLGQNAEGTTYVLVHILHRRTGGGRKMLPSKLSSYLSIRKTADVDRFNLAARPCPNPSFAGLKLSSLFEIQ